MKLFKVNGTSTFQNQEYDSNPYSTNSVQTKRGSYLTEQECRNRGIDPWNSRSVSYAGESGSYVSEGKRKKW